MADFGKEDFNDPEDVDGFIDENEDDLSSHDRDELKKIRKDLEKEKQERIEKRRKWAKYGVTGVLGLGMAVLLLGPLVQTALAPSTQQEDFNLEDQPMMGDGNASVTVVEFGDYRCPVCERFDRQVFPQIKQDYIDTGEAKFYFINYAFLDGNFDGDTSQTASVASECVYRQDSSQFWDFHHAVYDNQGEETDDWATEELLMNIARENTEGINYSELEQCIIDRETLDTVNEDRSIGQANAVTGTPSIFVNGEQLSSWGYTAVSRAIESELVK